MISTTAPYQLRQTVAGLAILPAEFDRAAVAATVAWHGQAADNYAVHAEAFAGHLQVEMAPGLVATANQLSNVADWQERPGPR